MSDVWKASRVEYRRQRSIYQVHYKLPRRVEETARPCPWRMARDVQAYGAQVAGHQKTEGTKYLGLLQSNNGTILKPILKESQKREVDFYERLERTDQSDLIELRSYVPKYIGCKKFTYNGFENDYIVLEDLTVNMIEPCIMDVKIGRQTWDPTAGEEKIANEKAKYALCKQEYGFCIPGFQVYRIPSGKLLKYGKDYGKKLHGKAVKDAVRSYLNCSSGAPCRGLLLQFLSSLWQVQRWAARGGAGARLYAASLLLVYDASALRECCGHSDQPWTRDCDRLEARLERRHSSSPGEGGASSAGPRSPPQGSASASTSPTPSPWGEALDRILPMHSYQHNYDEVMTRLRASYRSTLEQLGSGRSQHRGGTVKLIDFAHAFFTETEGTPRGGVGEGKGDVNFREGIDNFVALLEELLRESTD